MCVSVVPASVIQAFLGKLPVSRLYPIKPTSRPPVSPALLTPAAQTEPRTEANYTGTRASNNILKTTNGIYYFLYHQLSQKHYKSKILNFAFESFNPGFCSVINNVQFTGCERLVQ